MGKPVLRTTEVFELDGCRLEISALRREGDRDAFLFLHGFGSTKEDYADIIQNPAFDTCAFLAYDAPGCGGSSCADLSKICISFLVDTALVMLARSGIDRFHLIGHSMGGLTGLMLADAHPSRVLSFTSIEGNIAPEDCFLSRQVLSHPAGDPETFFDGFIDRTSRSPAYASALYAASLRHKVRPQAVPAIFRSMVDLSDNGNLMDRFLGLSCPTMFMYGAQNASLSYLGHIKAKGVRLSEIPECGHFPMYSNPIAMWRDIADFTGMS